MRPDCGLGVCVETPLRALVGSAQFGRKGGQLAALFTFSFGVLAFLAWLHATRRSTERICFLKTAALYFVGGGFLVAIPQIALELSTV